MILMVHISCLKNQHPRKKEEEGGKLVKQIEVLEAYIYIEISGRPPKAGLIF